MLNHSLDKYVPYSYQEIAKHAEGHELPINVYLPTVENEYNSVAVVCIHGGAWTSDLKQGEKWSGSWMKHTASLFASLGYTAIEITHRSITETGINGILSDVETAFRTVKTSIMPRHGLSKLYAIGDSAGGHLALMSAIFEDNSLRPEKVVACNPVSDLTDTKWQLHTTTEAERKNASPIYRDYKTKTEIFILHGDADQTVPLVSSEKLHAYLITLGVKSRLEILPDAAHAFILYGYRTSTEKVNEYTEKAVVPCSEQRVVNFASMLGRFLWRMQRR